MKLLTVAALLFASSSLAVPTNNGAACIPRPHPGHGGNGNHPGDGGNGNQPGNGGDNHPPGNGGDDNHPPGNGGDNHPPGNGGDNNPPGNGGDNNPPGNGGDNNPPGNGGDNNPPGNGGDNHPPGNGGDDNYMACPSGLYSNAQCCQTDVLGVLGLDCSTPDHTPKSGSDFTKECADVGKQAKCCVLPVAGQSVLCQDAIGGDGNNPPGGGDNNNPPGGGDNNNPPGGGDNNNPPGGGDNNNPPGGGDNNNPPGNGGDDDYKACPSGLYSNPQCCQTDVLGVAALDCSTPDHSPKNGGDFTKTCAASGKQAKCCVLPVAGQSLLCQDAIGGDDNNNPPGNGGDNNNPPGGDDNNNPPGGGDNNNPPGGGDNNNPPGGGDNNNPPGNGGDDDDYKACPSGLYSNPQCCQTDVLGIAALDCSTPDETPKSGSNFGSICAKGGKQAKCCVLPLLGQDVLCQDAIGAN